MIKFNKIPVFLAICVLILTATLGIWLLIGNSGDVNKTKLDIKKLYIVNIYGTEGYGYVDLQLDEKYLESVCKENGIELVASDVQVDISKENNLSNEDKFTIRYKNDKSLTDIGIELDGIEITYTVKGLKYGMDFDIFSDLSVYIKDGQLLIDNDKCSNFVKDNVDFFIKNQLETYKEGDTVIVGAHIDMNAATDNGYNIEKTEQEYILKEQEKTND